MDKFSPPRPFLLPPFRSRQPPLPLSLSHSLSLFSRSFLPINLSHVQPSVYAPSLPLLSTSLAMHLSLFFSRVTPRHQQLHFFCFCAAFYPLHFSISAKDLPGHWEPAIIRIFPRCTASISATHFLQLRNRLGPTGRHVAPPLCCAPFGTRQVPLLARQRLARCAVPGTETRRSGSCERRRLTSSTFHSCACDCVDAGNNFFERPHPEYPGELDWSIPPPRVAAC